MSKFRILERREPLLVILSFGRDLMSYLAICVPQQLFTLNDANFAHNSEGFPELYGSNFLKCPLCLRIFFENSVVVINMNCTEN